MSNHFPTVGVIGAGQLARMSVAPAVALGVNLLLLANDAQDSGALITNHVVGDYKDLDVKKFGFGFGDPLYPSMALLLAKSKTQDVKQPFYLRRPDAIESSAR